MDEILLVGGSNDGTVIKHHIYMNHQIIEMAPRVVGIPDVVPVSASGKGALDEEFEKDVYRVVSFHVSERPFYQSGKDHMKACYFAIPHEHPDSFLIEMLTKAYQQRP